MTGWLTKAVLAERARRLHDIIFPPTPPTIHDHPFTPVPWMKQCGYFPHPQAGRCFRKRYEHEDQGRRDQ